MFQAPPQLEKSWQEVLKEEWEKPYIQKLADFLAQERASKTPIYPPKHEVFAAFQKTPFEKVKVLIMGQDPYHGPGQAHGFSFSVKPEVKMPPSLKNIFKELTQDLQIPPPEHGCLLNWAEQGVLMLNAVLTVRENEPLSHRKKGWEEFTDAVISKLSNRQDPVIFVLWGKAAEEKCRSILDSNPAHIVLTAAHPSPYSAHSGFFGCQHFSKINQHLKKLGKDPIDWGRKI
jgi:uracil-DNA glycosylase